MVDYSFPRGLRSPLNLNHFQVPCGFVDRIAWLRLSAALCNLRIGLFFGSQDAPILIIPARNGACFCINFK